mgnify:FL=1|jgi:hypothetical protein
MSNENKYDWKERFTAQEKKQKELKALRVDGMIETEIMERALWDNDVMMLFCIANELNHKVYMLTK